MGTLRDALNRRMFVGNLRAVLATAIDIACGMAHLHSLNIVHSDLKVRYIGYKHVSNRFETVLNDLNRLHHPSSHPPPSLHRHSTCCCAVLQQRSLPAWPCPLPNPLLNPPPHVCPAAQALNVLLRSNASVTSVALPPPRPAS